MVEYLTAGSYCTLVIKLDIELERNGFRVCETAEFAGYSHENITKEIFRR